MANDPKPRNARAAIAACVIANMVDGFDVLVIAFAAPAIAREWETGPQLLGLIFSAGIAGITLGSLLIAPFAEKFGRRRSTVIALASMAISMLLSALAVDVSQLAALRFVTGLGVGAILPTLNSVVAESAPANRRNLAVGLFTAAYPLGSIVGGGLAILLLDTWGWRSMFIAGATATAFVTCLIWACLPSAGPASGARVAFSPLHLFRGSLGMQTSALATAFFFQMLAAFFVFNWTPRLLEQTGLGASEAVAIATAVNVGSLFGGLGYGLVADRFGSHRSAPSYAILFALTLILFGVLITSVQWLVPMAVLLGFFLGGSMTSLYALAPEAFPIPVRVAGTGLVIGVGRCGGVLGPLLAAWGLSAGLDSQALYAASAAAPAVAAVATIYLCARIFRSVL